MPQLSPASKNLPVTLAQGLEGLIDAYPLAALQQAYRTLSDRYRSLKDQQSSSPKPILITQEIQRLAYLVSRLPATYAVVHRVLEHLPREIYLTSLLDLGAGPGTVLWAARELRPELVCATLIEQDEALSSLAQQLLAPTLHTFSAIWQKKDLTRLSDLPAHNLVTLSYVLGELSSPSQSQLLDIAWRATDQIIVLIEPGTPTGFATLKRLRLQLLDLGAFLIAPCPHHNICPLSGQDWCHFSQSVERTVLHRRVKQASLPFEDEKYSYLIASKHSYLRANSRLVRRPKTGSGHFVLDLCTPNGLERHTISRKQKELYKIARTLKWGDAGPPLES